MKKIVSIVISGLILGSVVVSNASAGGLFADIFIRPISPEAADFVDQAHDEYKRANPNYGQWEEQTTNQFREDIGLQPHCAELFDKWGNSVGCQ